MKKISLQKFFPHRFGKWYEEHERTLGLFVFLGGFLFDNLMLVRIDKLIDILILGTWLCVAGAGIVSLNLAHHKVIRGEFFETLESWVPLAVQFAFGALFSGFTIFYMRSANIATSWPFLAIVLFLFFGNEFFKKRYVELNFQLTIFFVSILFLSIFFVPIAVGQMGVWVFILSGLVSVAITGAFVHALFAALPAEARKNERSLLTGIVAIFVVVNALYFTDIIPPIPLSLKDAGVYHYVARTKAGDYELRREPWHWYYFFSTSETVHLVSGEPLYFYSAVFAPTRLNTNIDHVWERYDPISGAWVFAGRIRFPIYGGADGGYRGYSEKTALSPGEWRVRVENDQGQVLGISRFVIVSVSKEPSLETLSK